MERKELIDRTVAVIEGMDATEEMHGLYIIAVCESKLLIGNVGLRPLGDNESVTNVFRTALAMAEDPQARDNIGRMMGRVNLTPPNHVNNTDEDEDEFDEDEDEEEEDDDEDDDDYDIGSVDDD